MAQGREVFHKLSKTSENNIAVWKDFPARSPRCHLLVKLSLKPVANLPHELLRLVGVCCYVDPAKSEQNFWYRYRSVSITKHGFLLSDSRLAPRKRPNSKAMLNLGS